jgi:hypothetical protein
MDRRAGMLVALMLLAAVPALAQNPPAPAPVADTAAVKVDSLLAHQRTRGDSIRPRSPITPGNAFLRSLVVPGWGQARLDRNVTAGVFVAFEGIALTMVWKSGWQLDYAQARGKLVKSHTQEQQDWIALLVFNHLIAAAEAYVSAHLYDFPAGLKMQALPGGRTGVGLAVPF